MNHPAVGHGVGDVQIAKVSHSPFEKEVHPHDKRYGGINVRTGREEAEVEGTREKWDAHYGPMAMRAKPTAITTKEVHWGTWLPSKP